MPYPGPKDSAEEITRRAGEARIARERRIKEERRNPPIGYKIKR